MYVKNEFFYLAHQVIMEYYLIRMMIDDNHVFPGYLYTTYNYACKVMNMYIQNYCGAIDELDYTAIRKTLERDRTVEYYREAGYVFIMDIVMVEK